LSKNDREKIMNDPHGRNGVLVSSLTGEGLQNLTHRIADSVSDRILQKEFFIPKEKMGLLHFLYQEAEVLLRHDGAEGVVLKVNLSPKTEELFKRKYEADGGAGL